MKASYLNNFTSSFFLWLDHELLSKGEAFLNYSGKLYASNDAYYDDTSSVYASPFKQWVYDSSITNAIVPSGVYVNNNFVSKGVSGLSLDFNRGRAIFDNNFVNTNNITANYSFKEFNIYYTDEKEEKLLFEKAYTLTPKVTMITGGLTVSENPYPCVFFKVKTNENIPFAFGGLDTTKNWVRCIVLAKDIFSLDSIVSVLNDSARKVFPVFEAKDLPFNYIGDLKSGVYNYNNMCNAQQNNKLVFIKKVTCTKFEESENLYINKKTLAAFVDFEIESIRNPRS